MSRALHARLQSC